MSTPNQNQYRHETDRVPLRDEDRQPTGCASPVTAIVTFFAIVWNLFKP